MIRELQSGRIVQTHRLIKIIKMYVNTRWFLWELYTVIICSLSRLKTRQLNTLQYQYIIVFLTSDYCITFFYLFSCVQLHKDISQRKHFVNESVEFIFEKNTQTFTGHSYTFKMATASLTSPKSDFMSLKCLPSWLNLQVCFQFP